MEPVTVRYKLSEKEFLDAAQLISAPHTAEMKFRRIAGYIFIAPGFFLLLISLAVEWPVAVALTIALLVLRVFVSRSHLLKAARHYYRNDGKFRDAMTLTFTAENLTVQSKHMESKLGWKLYTDVLESENCYALVYGEDLRMMTIVPKRAFQSQRQHLAFRELLGALFRRALPLHQPGERATPELMQEPREFLPHDYQPQSFEPPDWR